VEGSGRSVYLLLAEGEGEGELSGYITALDLKMVLGLRTLQDSQLLEVSEHFRM
jgi:hypothetical protein